MLNQISVEILHQIVLIAVQVMIFSIIFLFRRSVPLLQSWLDHHTTLAERAVIQQIGHEAFIFAENAFHSEAGEKKLEQALQYGIGIANRKGISVNSDEIRSAVERAVMEANAVKQRAQQQ